MHTVWKLESCVLYCCFYCCKLYVVLYLLVLLYCCFNLAWYNGKFGNERRQISKQQELPLKAKTDSCVLKCSVSIEAYPFELPLKARVEK